MAAPSPVNAATGAAGRQPASDVAFRVFGFPHAGGNASLFVGWQDRMPAGVELVAVTPPGHGVRLRERRFQRLLPLARALALEMRPLMDRPCAFVGYSMGALVAFEVCRELRRTGTLLPVHLSVYGASAPEYPPLRESIHELPDAEFLVRLKAFGGTPDAVLQHRELMQLATPILRADFEALATYEFREEAPLRVPIHAIGARDDHSTTAASIRAWQRHTSAGFLWRMDAGAHGFVIAEGPRIADGVAEAVRPYLGGRGARAAVSLHLQP